jgi:hypothetical protein
MSSATIEPKRHRRRLGAGLLLCALAWAGGAAAGDTATLCRDQAGITEHALGLPPGLLLAVGRVESGRDDPDSRDVLPWPWSVNDEGEDHVFGSAFDAIAYVVAAHARGSRSIDVGCFQVNLMFHPEAFASLTEAFDPAANARAAGMFLAELHARADSWEKAVELYHSATPWRGAAYRDLVLARWREATTTPPRLLPSAAAATGGSEMIAVPAQLRAAASPAATPAPRPPVARSRIASVHVHYPGAPADTAAPIRGRMPRVIVPSTYAAR